jgi:hypothetical protein
VVSVQDSRKGDALAGHLAWGDLARPSLVAVRDVDWAEDADADFEVLLASALPDGSGYVERIRPERIDVVRRSPSSEEKGAIVWLAQPSRHPAPHPDPAPGEARSLARSGPDRAAVLAAGPRPSDQAAADGSDALLARIVEWERDLRRGLVQHDADDVPHVQFWWCFLFGGCWGHPGRQA